MLVTLHVNVQVQLVNQPWIYADNMPDLGYIPR